MTMKKQPHAEHLAANTAVMASPPLEEKANVSTFDELAQSLGLTSGAARPQRWISRVGGLLRDARARQNIGQSELAHRAELTQPYLSRLENGLLPKRGPTADVLMRFAEAIGCDLELSLRNKQTGEVLGSVSTAELERSRPPTTSARPIESAQAPPPVAATPVVSTASATVRDVMNLVIGQQRGNTPPQVLQVEVKREPDGRVSQVSLKHPEPSPVRVEHRATRSERRYKFVHFSLKGKDIPVLRIDTRTQKRPVGEKGGVTVGKCIVIGKSGSFVYGNAPGGRSQKVRIRSPRQSSPISKEEYDG